MDIWVVSTLRLWTIMFKLVCGPMFSFLLSVCLGIELLDHMIAVCLTFGRTVLHFSPAVYEVALPFWFSPLFKVWIDISWWLDVFLFPKWLVIASIFSCIYWPFGRMSIQILCSFKKINCLSFSCNSFFIAVSPNQIWLANIFSFLGGIFSNTIYKYYFVYFSFDKNGVQHVLK